MTDLTAKVVGVSQALPRPGGDTLATIEAVMNSNQVGGREMIDKVVAQ